MAAFLRVSIGAHLRPNELMGLQRMGIVAPAAGAPPIWRLLLFTSQEIARSKTNLSDVSAAMGSPCMQLLAPVLLALAEGPRSDLT